MADEDASRRIRARRERRAGVLAVVGFVVFMAVGVSKCALNDASVDTHLERAFVDLDGALAGDEEGWERSRDGFREAARQSVFDTYPVFCLSVVDDVARAREVSKPGPARVETLDDVPAALLGLPRAEIREGVVAITADSRGDVRARATYYLRFLGDLEVGAASRQRQATAAE